MSFYTKAQPREELWNLMNKIPIGTKRKFESLVFFSTCARHGLFVLHSIPAPSLGGLLYPQISSLLPQPPRGWRSLAWSVNCIVLVPAGRAQVSMWPHLATQAPPWLSHLGLKNFSPPTQQTTQHSSWDGSHVRPESFPFFFRFIWVGFL